jgi:hypothetical protein
MKRKQTLLLSIVLLMGLCVLVPAVYYSGRPAMVEMREELYPGIVYYRKVHYFPRLMVAHILTADLREQSLDVFITPADRRDREEPYPLNARTTKQFVTEFDLIAGINGDGFTPWWSNHPLDYYPRPGDPVVTNGFTAVRGRTYGLHKGPTIYIYDNRKISFGALKGELYNAISGSHWIVRNREPVTELPDNEVAPRTAIGVDGPGNRLIMIVVDGRQPFYSEGATISELAELILFYGGDNAILLDGGGSSTMVIRDPLTGEVKIINSPIDRGIPGLERAVANHFGIKIR